jgi:hypothetical protein
LGPSSYQTCSNNRRVSYGFNYLAHNIMYVQVPVTAE